MTLVQRLNFNFLKNFSPLEKVTGCGERVIRWSVDVQGVLAQTKLSKTRGHGQLAPDPTCQTQQQLTC